MQHTVIGMFRDSDDAHRAAERLREKGFAESVIDVSSARAGDSLNREDSPYSVSDESRYPASGSTGSYTNTSDSVNEDRINRRRDDNDEGFGESVGRFFRRLFDNEEEVEKYSRVGQSHSIVSVYAESTEEAERAREILDESGAIDVDENAQRYGDYTRTTDDTRSASEYTSRDTVSAEGITSDATDKTIPVIEENVNIGKREVESGGVRLRSRIVERPVEENLRLREERVFVERVPVNRPATDADFDTFREGEIELTETSEVPIVNKEARVVEEVRLNKEVTERDETVRDTVRKTDVDVEKLSDETRKTRKRTKR